MNFKDAVSPEYVDYAHAYPVTDRRMPRALPSRPRRKPGDEFKSTAGVRIAIGGRGSDTRGRCNRSP